MTEKKPNLIYVFADQLRYSSVGFNGDEKAKTPLLDSISRDCEIMDRTFSGHPVCAPYRASLLTGKYTTSTGMVINEIRINPNHKSFAHVLNENGYETSYIGKWHLYAAKLGDHFNPENSFIPEGPDRLGFDGYFAAYNFHHKYFSPDAYYHLNTPEKVYYEKYEPDEQTDMAIERIHRHKESGKPFALFLSIGTPHDPWSKDNVPEEYYEKFRNTDFPLPPNYRKHNDRYADAWARFLPGKRKLLEENKRVYYSMVSNLDDNIGRLMQAIKDEGMEDDTIFVFTSDHGEMFGAQGRHAKNIFYDEAIRVPFIVKWGNRLPKVRNITCFNTVDIMPTLLDMMGLPVPDEVQGKSIKDSIMTGEFTENSSLLMGTGPTAIYGSGFEWRGLRTERYTYAIYRVDKKEFLFDNVTDPFQTKNLAKDPEYRDLLSKLKDEMYSKMNEIGDNFEKNSYYRKHWIRDRKILEDLH